MVTPHNHPQDPPHEHAFAFTEPERQRLRTLVNLASESIPLNWPMRTFISRSPLMGFEHLPFDQAVSQAKELFGGEVYLSNEEYRAYYAEGRISKSDLLRAIRQVSPSATSVNSIRVGSRTIDPEEILRLHFVHGIEPLDPRLLQWKLTHEGASRRIDPDVPEPTRRQLRSHAAEWVRTATGKVGQDWTIAHWIFHATLVDLPGSILQSLEREIDHGETHLAQGQNGDGDVDRTLKSLGLSSTLQAQYVPCVERVHHSLPSSHPAHQLRMPHFVKRWIGLERQFLSSHTAELFGCRGRFDRLTRSVQHDPEAFYIQSLWSAAHKALNLFDQRSHGSQHAGPTAEAASLSPAGSEPEPDGHHTVAEMVDRLAGSQVVQDINDQMIKWCAAFMDEGMADWSMPSRTDGFYLAWRNLAVRPASGWGLGITDWSRKVLELPRRAEDALETILRRLGIPEPQRTDYLRRHLAQLPGWAGYVRYRGNNPDYPEQARHRIDPLEYLTVRLFYEAAWAETVCRHTFGITGDRFNILACLQDKRREFFIEKKSHADSHDARTHAISRDVWRLFQLAQFMELAPEDLQQLSPDAAQTVLLLLDRFPLQNLRPIWHEAYEGHYRESLITKLASRPRQPGNESSARPRPQAQAAFCIDVRSETFRRHLEAQGGYETVGFAGFFGVPICYRPLDRDEELLLCPVLIKPKYAVSEAPGPDESRHTQNHVLGQRWSRLGHHVFHDLKASPIGSYMTIDLFGFLFGLALLGKTVLVEAYRRSRQLLRGWLLQPIPTRIPFEKLTQQEVDTLLATGERASIAQVLGQHFTGHRREQALAPEAVEEFRLAAISPPRRAPERRSQPRRETKVSEKLGLSIEEERSLLQGIQSDYGINARSHQVQLDRLSARGFTPQEQAFVVETALRVMSVTKNFARLVLLCGHGSTTDNNPYASALDCGACGGNHGGPNARVLSTMANKAEVRAELRARDIEIPDDTWFVAGQHDTTTDQVTLFEIEDLPATHRPDCLQLQRDLEAAGLEAARERCGRLPRTPRRIVPRMAGRHVRRRSADWAQVRPEWGLSNNAAFIIGRRQLTQSLNLEGRTFLHNYDSALDHSGKVLETLMTAPLVVAEWINLQYYFSAVAPWTYGSGSKVLHNVVSGIGIMLGRHSDLQTGLPLQTVNDGPRHYHEPQRLLTIIEAEIARITDIVSRHEVLQRFFNNQWVHLISLDPVTGKLTRFQPGGAWIPVLQETGEGA